MLETPLGKVIIQKNGKVIEYSAIPQALKVTVKCNYNVDARYLLLVDTTTIKPGDTIKCIIECQNAEVSINDGECLSLLDFKKDNILLSLGAYEILYHYNSKFAFDICHLENGLESYFYDTQCIEDFRLAVSWMELNDKRDEVSTWYASDPRLCNK